VVERYCLLYTRFEASEAPGSTVDNYNIYANDYSPCKCVSMEEVYAGNWTSSRAYISALLCHESI
jgi:hypothetical protein